MFSFILGHAIKKLIINLVYFSAGNNVVFFPEKENVQVSWHRFTSYITNNSTGPFVLPCTVRTRTLGQSTK